MGFLHVGLVNIVTEKKYKSSLMLSFKALSNRDFSKFNSLMKVKRKFLGRTKHFGMDERLWEMNPDLVDRSVKQLCVKKEDSRQIWS